MSETNELKSTRASSWLSLLTSSSTLLCCALPALLVAVGAGAALSSLVAAVPQLVWISEQKIQLFTVAAAMLAIAGVFQWQARLLPCPTDSRLARKCAELRLRSLLVYVVSVCLFAVGGFFAFLAPIVLG